MLSKFLACCLFFIFGFSGSTPIHYNAIHDQYVLVDRDYDFVLPVNSFFQDPDGKQLSFNLSGLPPDISWKKIVQPLPPAYLGSYIEAQTVHSVVVRNSIAYIAAKSDGLVILDVSNPTSPSLLGSFVTPSYAEGVYLVSNNAYVATYTYGLLIIDISNPSSPFLLGSCDTPGNARKVFVFQDIAYIADRGPGLIIINVSNSSSPFILGSIDTGSASDVWVKNDIAYVADFINGLIMVNVSDPSNPSILASFTTTGTPEGIYLVNDTAYVAAGMSGLRIVSVSVPSSPYLLGSIDTDQAYGIFVQNDIAYVAEYGRGPGLLLIDVSNPSSPYLLRYYYLPGNLECVTVINEIGYVASVYGGFHILNISLAVMFNSYGELQKSLQALPKRLKVQNDIAYIAAGNAGIEIINVSIPSSPSLLVIYGTSYAQGVFLDGNIAYVADYMEGLKILNVSNPASPSLVGFIDTPSYAVSVFVLNDIAYVADSNSGIQIINVSIPDTPTLLGSYNTPGNCKDVFVVNSIAYIADGFAGLQIINVSDPASPSPLGSYDSGTYNDAERILVINDFAYLADGVSGLLIFNISNTSSPSLLGSYDTPGLAKSFFISEDIAYVADGAYGVHILDISNFSSPSLLGSYFTVLQCNDVFLYNGMLYSADYYFGLKIIIPFNYPSFQGVAIPTRYETSNYDVAVVASHGLDDLSVTFRMDLYGIVLPNANYTLNYPLNDVYVVASVSECHLNISLSDPYIGTLNTNTSGSVTSIYDVGLGLWQAEGSANDINNILLYLSLNFLYPCSKAEYISFNLTFSLYDDHSGLIDERIITIEDQCIFYLNQLIPDQYWIVEEVFNFQFSNSTFIEINNYKIFYNISSPSYIPLPDWLSFNTENRTFFASALDSFDELPLSSINIIVKASVQEYGFTVPTTSFTLYLLHATKTNTSSVLFPDVYLFDILNYASPIEYISFSLTNTSLIPSEELASLELISSLVFTGDNSSNFNATFIKEDEENAEYSIKLSVIHSSISVIGTLSASLSIFCDFPYEDRLCAIIPFSINIIGPLATTSKSIIDFGIMSKYDILSRNNTDYAIKREIILIANHSSEYSDITPFYYTLNPTISYDSINSILFSSSIIPNINHDLLFNITINNYFEGPFNYQVTLTCHIQDMLYPVPCGSFSIIGTISTGSTFIYNDTTQIFFNLNSYDMLVRDESYLLHSFYLYPNNILPLIESISPFIVLEPYNEITNVSYFSTVNIDNNPKVLFNLYLKSSEPLLDLSSQLIIYSVDIDSQSIPCHSKCADITISGNIQSPIYSLSTNSIHFGDIDDKIVQENANNYSFVIKANNTLSIPLIDSDIDELYFIIDTECSIIDDSNTFYITTIIHENETISDQSQLLFIQDIYIIDLNFTNINFPRYYYANLECTINDPYYSNPTEIIPIQLNVIGGYPLISPSYNIISFGNFTVDSREDLLNWQGKQITLNLTNIGNEILSILFVQINQPSESKPSFFLSRFACQSTILHHFDYCLYNISFLPARDGSFNDINIIFSFDSSFRPFISIPITSLVIVKSNFQSSKSTVIDFIIDIYPYISGVFGFLLILFFILLFGKKRLKIENQETSLLFVAILSIYDFIADIIFTLSLFTSSEPGSRILFLIAAGTIVVSFLINIIILFSFIKNQLNKNPAFSEWFSKNSTKLGFVIFLSSTNLAVAKLMTSNILKLGIFSAPITVEDQYRLDSYSIITQFTENIPQLALQLFIAFSLDINDWPDILIFSLFGSILMIVFGLINRTLSWLFVWSKSKKDVSIPSTAKGTNIEISRMSPQTIELPIGQRFE